MKRKKPDPLSEILDRFFLKMETIEEKIDTLTAKMEAGNNAKGSNVVSDTLPPPGMDLKPKEVSALSFLFKFEENCCEKVCYEPNYSGLTAGLRYDEEGDLAEVFTVNDFDKKELIIDESEDIKGIPTKIDASNETIWGILTTKSDDDISESIKGRITKALLIGSPDRQLYFIPFVGTQTLHDRFSDYDDLLTWFDENQFIIPESQGLFVKHNLSATGGFGIDSEYYFNGVVVKSTNIKNWSTQYASAYKFVNVLYPTNLINVSWQSSSDGVAIGVGQISSTVFEDGKTYSQCLIPNFDILSKDGVNQGALIDVYENKPGRVVIGAPEKLGNGKRFFKPNRCPTCQSDLISRDDRCSNVSCSSLILNKLIKAIWPLALDIDGLESTHIEELYTNGRLKTLGDLLALDEATLFNVGISKKFAKKIVSTVQKLDKNRPLCFWLHALDIPGLPIGRCLVIEEYVKEYYEYVRVEDLMEVLGDKETLTLLCGVEVMGVSAYTVLHYSAIYDFLSLFNWPKFNSNRNNKYQSVSILGRGFVNYERLQQKLYEEGFLLSETIVEADKCVLVGDSPAPMKMSLVSRYMLTPIDITDMTIEGIVKAVKEMKDEV